MSNEIISVQLKNWLDQNHIKHNYIAKLLDLSTPTLCLFLQGKREIAQDKLLIINEIING